MQSTGRGHSVTVTNDGATILKSLHIDNPAAKVLIGILDVKLFLCYFALSYSSVVLLLLAEVLFCLSHWLHNLDAVCYELMADVIL